MMLALRASSLKWMPEYEFMHFPLDPKDNPYREIALKRIEKCLELFEQGYDEVIHIGADWLFCGTPWFPESYPALFVPHIQREFPNKSQAKAMMKAGVINSDLQVWRKTFMSICFLEMFQDQIKDTSFDSIFEYEQAWLPFALPITGAQLIEGDYIGTAWYNLHERCVDQYTELFHFSGNKYHQGDERLSIHGNPPREFTEFEKEFFESYKRMVRSCEQ